jgi:alpha-ribazole phosphatase
MEVLLVRHGKTAGNLLRRYIGRTDEPLCPEGIEHAHATGRDGKVTSVYVSPMKRALETAVIKFPNAGHIICADLREMDFGNFEGRSADDMINDEVYRQWVDSSCTLPCPGGEQMADFNDRVCKAFDTIIRESIDRMEQRVVLVAHGGTLMAILDRYAVPRREYYEWYVGNCGGYRAHLDEAAWSEAPALTDCVKFDCLD